MSSFQATGSGAMSETFSNRVHGKYLTEIRLHLSLAASTVEDFTVDLDSGAGSEYDVNIYTKAMSTVKDVVYTFNRPVRMTNAGDKIVCTYANSDSRTWGLEIVYESKI